MMSIRTGSLDDIAGAQGISRATVEREWQAARAWLYRRLTQRGPDSPVTGMSWPGATRSIPGTAEEKPVG